MTAPYQILVFLLADQRFALPFPVVERVVSAVEITPLPKAPSLILGLINLQGLMVPVFNLRKRFSLPEREIELTDCFIIARTLERIVALAVDGISDVVAYGKGEMEALGQFPPGLEHVKGVVHLPDGMIFVHDLERFLSLEQEQALAGAMREEEGKR